MKKILKVIVTSLVFVVILAACGGSKANAMQELRLVSAAPMNTLNHIINGESVNSQVIENFLEGLITYDDQQKLVGAMAEKWDVSADGLTYTFHLRNGIEWSNGKPVTANDFVFSWRTLATNKKASYTPMLIDAKIKNAAAVINGEKDASELGVVAQDEKTLVVTLDEPSILFEPIVAISTFAPINEEFYNSVGGADVFGTSADTVLSNGPFKVTVWQADSEYVLEKNPTYWDAKNVKLDKVSTRIVKEPATQATLYDKGEIDRLSISTDLYERYKDDPNIVRQDEASWFYLYLSGNVGNKSKVLNNHNFRAAIAHAIDKELITNQILKNGSIPSNSVIPQKFDNIDGKDFRTYANNFNESIFDVQKAQSYLEAAKRELAGEDLSFELVISDGAVAKTLFENVKAQIEQGLPGVRVTLTSVPSNTFYSKLQEYHTPASHAGWAADYIDVSTYFSVFRTGDSHNYGRWENAQYNNLLALADKETNRKKRWDYFVEAEKILLEDYAIVPLYQRGSTAVMNPKVKNYSISPISSRVLFKYVYIEE